MKIIIIILCYENFETLLWKNGHSCPLMSLFLSLFSGWVLKVHRTILQRVTGGKEFESECEGTYQGRTSQRSQPGIRGFQPRIPSLRTHNFSLFEMFIFLVICLKSPVDSDWSDQNTFTPTSPTDFYFWILQTLKFSPKLILYKIFRHHTEYLEFHGVGCGKTIDLAQRMCGEQLFCQILQHEEYRPFFNRSGYKQHADLDEERRNRGVWVRNKYLLH